MKGWKTWVGTVGWAVCEGLKNLTPTYAPALEVLQSMVFLPLGVIGLGHKLDRASVT